MDHEKEINEFESLEIETGDWSCFGGSLAPARKAGNSVSTSPEFINRK